MLGLLPPQHPAAADAGGPAPQHQPRHHQHQPGHQPPRLHQEEGCRAGQQHRGPRHHSVRGTAGD